MKLNIGNYSKIFSSVARMKNCIRWQIMGHEIGAQKSLIKTPQALLREVRWSFLFVFSFKKKINKNDRKENDLALVFHGAWSASVPAAVVQEPVEGHCIFPSLPSPDALLANTSSSQLWLYFCSPGANVPNHRHAATSATTQLLSEQLPTWQSTLVLPTKQVLAMLYKPLKSKHTSKRKPK